MKLRRAGEIVIPLETFPYIPHWFTLRQAMAELSQSRHAAAGGGTPGRTPWMMLVFSADNRLMGFVRMRGVMLGLVPEELAGERRQHREKLFDVAMDQNLYAMYFSNDEVIGRLKRLVERPVSNFMTPIEVTVDFEDSVLTAITLMITRNLTCISVTRDGQIIGIIDAADAVEEVVALLV